MEPTFFPTGADFRGWLDEHHATETELLVGFYKKSSGKPSITWPEAVDEALCFGWIDGVRKSIDGESYTIRFTPRKERSIWSAVNIARAEELTRLGLMRPAGSEAFARRSDERSRIYSYERANAALPADYEQRFRADEAAWAHFEKMPASYRKAAAWWVASAKKEETRERRLGQLIEDSANGRTVPPLTRPQK